MIGEFHRPAYFAVDVLDAVRHVNVMALVGFGIALVSMFYAELWILPPLGIVFSLVGLTSFQAETERLPWVAGIGLALSVLSTAFLYPQ